MGKFDSYVDYDKRRKELYQGSVSYKPTTKTPTYSNQTQFGKTGKSIFETSPYQAGYQAPKVTTAPRTDFSEFAVSKNVKPRLRLSELQSQSSFIDDYINSLGIKKAGTGINLGQLYKAYGEQAASSRAALEAATRTKKADLATSIKRLREDIAESKRRKQEAYQGTRADIEEAGFMATRANRASAAARGLSGSGLEQLSQLQQMIRQGRTISQEAGEQAIVQEELREELTEGEEDYTKGLSDLTEAEKVGLQQIAATLAGNKATASSEAAAAAAVAEANYRNALTEARASGVEQYQYGAGQFDVLMNKLQAAGKTESKIDDVEEQANALAEEGVLTPSMYNTVISNIKKYKQYKGIK